MNSEWVSMGSMEGAMMVTEAAVEVKSIEVEEVQSEYMKADEAFLEALREYRIISNQEKVLKAKKDLIKDKIARTMGPKFYAVDEDGLVVCTYKEDAVKFKFDEASFEKDYPQMYLQYMIEDTRIIRRLSPKL